MLVFALLFLIRLVNAAEVCVVAYYPSGEADSKCIDMAEGKNGYNLMQEVGWSLLWSPNTTYGHMLCKIKDIGTEVSGNFCAYSGDFWNIVLNRNNKWVHLPVGLDAPGNCWNYDINSWDGHYCTKDGDVLGFAFGSAGSKPEMFKANITKVYVDGEKQKESNVRRGKITDVFPGSTVEIKIELENLYDSATDIEIVDISTEGTIEEIDDGDDIEEEIKEFDLGADRKDSKTLKFEIPLEVEAKDRLLTIEIKAEDDAGIKYEKEFTYDLEVEKEKNELKIIKAELNKDSYKCGENALLSFSLINIGAKEENVNLKIVNEDLKLDINEDFELSNDAFEESSKYENRFNIRIPENIDKMAYPITITAEYGTEKEAANLNLVVNECEKKAVINAGEKKEVKESKEITDVQTGEISKEVQTGGKKEIKEAETTTIEEKINNNMGLVLTVVLGILVVLVVLLLVIFWVIKR